MLDTHARKKVEFLFDKGSDFFLRCNLSPTHVTVMALSFGVLSSITLYFQTNFYIPLALLWFSGFLDAVDGNMARKTKQTSKLGTLMDIVFDRIVEISLIIALALKYEEAVFSLMILACSIIISMTIFLTTGNLVKNSGKKSFHYQKGLMERTEGFIFFSMMMIFNSYVVEISYLFATCILFTAIQRFFNAKKLFSDEE